MIRPTAIKGPTPGNANAVTPTAHVNALPLKTVAEDGVAPSLATGFFS